jgi:hypothetical protein
MAKHQHAQHQGQDAAERILQERDAIVMEVMREVFARLPFGTTFTLSDGSVARLEKYFEPQLCDDAQSQYHERPHFGVDVMIEGGKVDHVGISAFQTDSAIVVDPAELQQAPGKWTRRQAGQGGGDARRASPVERRQEERKGRSSGGR